MIIRAGGCPSHDLADSKQVNGRLGLAAMYGGPSRRQERAKSQICHELLDSFGATNLAKLGVLALSYGEQKRVEIACTGGRVQLTVPRRSYGCSNAGCEGTDRQTNLKTRFGVAQFVVDHRLRLPSIVGPHDRMRAGIVVRAGWMELLGHGAVRTLTGTGMDNGTTESRGAVARGYGLVEDSSFARWLASKAEVNGDRIAVIADDGTASYAELDERSTRIARGLLAAGLRPGDRVAVMMANSLATVIVGFGVAKAGLIEVPINTAYRGAFLDRLVADCQPAALIADDNYLAAVDHEFESVRGRVWSRRSGESTGQAGTRGIDDLLETAPGPLPAVDGREPVVILYTSGTTGPAKGVVISHAACINLGKVTAGVMEYGRDDTTLAVFPLFHQNAKYKSLMAALDSDGRIVVASRFSASRFWDTCRAYDVTTFNYLGAMLLMLWNQPVRVNDREHRVRRACGAGAPTDVRRRFEERFGVRLTEVYGLTEAPMVTAQMATKAPAGSSGRTHGTYSLRVVDDARQVVPASVVGGIEVRPLMPAVMMLRYHGPAWVTEEAWRDGWFQTGDRGWLDADGELHFAGRQKDSIRRRGENISAWEVETALAGHPSVRESAAYGVDSPLSDEEVMIAVTPGASAQGDEAELAWTIWRHCKEHLPAFAVPRYIRLVAVLPRTATGRVEKWRLREDGVSDDTFDTISWSVACAPGSVPNA